MTNLQIYGSIIFLENDQSASPLVFWETFKLDVHCTLTSYINRLKAYSAATIDRAMAELSSSEQSYARDPTPTLAASLKLQNRVVNQLQYERARQKLFFSK